jgi:hypothetical protein
MAPIYNEESEYIKMLRRLGLGDVAESHVNPSAGQAIAQQNPAAMQQAQQQAPSAPPPMLPPAMRPPRLYPQYGVQAGNMGMVEGPPKSAPNPADIQTRLYPQYGVQAGNMGMVEGPPKSAPNPADIQTGRFNPGQQMPSRGMAGPPPSAKPAGNPYDEGRYDVPVTSPNFYSPDYLGVGQDGTTYGLIPEPIQGMSPYAPSPYSRVDENIREGIPPTTQPFRQGDEFLRREGFQRGHSTSGGPSSPGGQMPQGNRRYIENEIQKRLLEVMERSPVGMDDMGPDIKQEQGFRVQYLLAKRETRTGLSPYEENELAALQAGLFTPRKARSKKYTSR